MIDLEFEFTGRLWNAKGESWYFITVPADMSADIKTFTRHKYKGFGSVRVKVRAGNSEWLTSLFPDKKSGCYFMPVKAAIRKSENLVRDRDVDVCIEVQI